MTDRSRAVESFREFARKATLDVFEGALIVAQLVEPEEDIVEARSRVDLLADRVREARRSGERPVDALRRVLFTEEGFSGDTASYDDPRNSSVARVIDTRRGMPITLSIVTAEVGRRAGMDLAGVGLPGHFVVGGLDLPPGLYLDPFERGQLSDAASLTERISTTLGTPVVLPPEAFVPDSARAILMRVLMNLRRSWERRDLFGDALAALECAQALDPDEVSFRRERGLLLLRAGRTPEALQELREFAATADDENAEALEKLIAIVEDGGAPAGLLAGQPEALAKKIFTLDQARQLLPRVQEITSEAVLRYLRLGAGDEAEEERQGIVREWVQGVTSLGVEIKGLWLVDFDSGAGYYCWKYPESSLDHFHGYDEGYAARLPLQ